MFVTVSFQLELHALIPYHMFFLLHIAAWIVPTVHGDIPPPQSSFSLTKISSEQALMCGGVGPGGHSSVVRVATLTKNSVVSVHEYHFGICCYF